MQETIHFISGLPRSGSTLLSALLRQNPRLHASISSPVCGMVNALLREMSRANEYSYFIDDEQRAKILRGCFAGYYHHLGADRVIFDTNRLWTSKITALAGLFPQSKMICCVRNVAWVVDSFESLIRRNYLQPSKIFNFDPAGNVYTRTEGLTAAAGIVGSSLYSLREAVYGDQVDRLLLVRFESLTSDPLGTLEKIYAFLGEPPYRHDPNHVEPCPGTLEFDAHLGTPGLHKVYTAVCQQHRRSILPTELFNRYAAFSFWQNASETPSGVRLV